MEGIVLKNKILTIFAAFGLVIMTSLSAQAAWYTVTVDNVGADNTTINIRITDTASNPAFTRIWVQAAGSTSQEIMATALTAVALEKNLLVNIDGTAAWSNLKGAYIIP
jgi:hypothetical protein